jgi:hypothetical protein
MLSRIVQEWEWNHWILAVFAIITSRLFEQRQWAQAMNVDFWTLDAARQSFFISIP